MKKVGLILATALFAVVTFALSATPAHAATHKVKMGSDTGQLAYVPDTLSVSPGDEIEFVMNKLAPHNVVFDSSGVPNGAQSIASSLTMSKLLFSPGQSYTITIPEDAPKGEYNYYCQPHRGAGMNGKLIVE
ncbi:plastocyanin [Euhalothece natronophila Z-M001]|uniref:Plastocyanin n=2 Tax=Euhalothece TaxID=65097 RepID=A0A5B8NR05_9CHRO|nr:plastocyanin [Euhalothece natronophila Z-M001]